MKITPAHDFNDYNIGKRHGLEMINIFTDDGKVNDNGSQFEVILNTRMVYYILHDITKTYIYIFAGSAKI